MAKMPRPYLLVVVLDTEINADHRVQNVYYRNVTQTNGDGGIVLKVCKTMSLYGPPSLTQSCLSSPTLPHQVWSRT